MLNIVFFWLGSVIFMMKIAILAKKQLFKIVFNSGCVARSDTSRFVIVMKTFFFAKKNAF